MTYHSLYRRKQLLFQSFSQIVLLNKLPFRFIKQKVLTNVNL